VARAFVSAVAPAIVFDAELLENPALEEGKEDAATDEYADGVSPEEGMDNGVVLSGFHKKRWRRRKEYLPPARPSSGCFPAIYSRGYRWTMTDCSVNRWKVSVTNWLSTPVSNLRKKNWKRLVLGQVTFTELFFQDFIKRGGVGERNIFRLLVPPEHQCELVEYLIGSLDDDGLLRKSLESICDELAIYAGIACSSLERLFSCNL